MKQITHRKPSLAPLVLAVASLTTVFLLLLSGSKK